MSWKTSLLSIHSDSWGDRRERASALTFLLLGCGRQRPQCSCETGVSILKWSSCSKGWIWLTPCDWCRLLPWSCPNGLECVPLMGYRVSLEPNKLWQVLKCWCEPPEDGPTICPGSSGHQRLETPRPVFDASVNTSRMGGGGLKEAFSVRMAGSSTSSELSSDWWEREVSCLSTLSWHGSLMEVQRFE